MTLLQKPAENQAFFISFEGIEGSGKSTQIQLFCDYLKSQKKQVHFFREPGGTTFGESLRQVMLSSQKKIHSLSQAMLFAAARCQLIEEKIQPLLNDKNNIIVVDRYMDSSLAYQGIAGGLGFETILQLHQHPPLNLVPNLTFYLAIDFETSQKRQQTRGQAKDYFESKDKKFYQDLIQGYEQAAAKFSDRIMKIDASQNEQAVSQAIQKQWEDYRG